MNKFAFALLFACTSALAQNYTCTKGTLRKDNFGEKTSLPSEYCYNADKNSLLSKACLKKNCRAFKGPNRYYISELTAEVGNPAFRLCHEVGGKAEFVEFLAEGKYYQLDRCVFSETEYADTDLLMDFYLDRGGPN